MNYEKYAKALRKKEIQTKWLQEGQSRLTYKGQTLAEELQILREQGVQIRLDPTQSIKQGDGNEVMSNYRTDKFDTWNEVYDEMHKGVKEKKAKAKEDKEKTIKE